MIVAVTPVKSQAKPSLASPGHLGNHQNLRIESSKSRSNKLHQPCGQAPPTRINRRFSLSASPTHSQATNLPCVHWLAPYILRLGHSPKELLVMSPVVHILYIILQHHVYLVGWLPSWFVARSSCLNLHFCVPVFVYPNLMCAAMLLLNSPLLCPKILSENHHFYSAGNILVWSCMWVENPLTMMRKLLNGLVFWHPKSVGLSSVSSLQLPCFGEISCFSGRPIISDRWLVMLYIRVIFH